MPTQAIDKNTLYLIYDECPLCRISAHALNIKKAVGNLILINARELHPLVSSAYARGFDPDLGIIVIYNDQYYFGADAAHFLASGRKDDRPGLKACLKALQPGDTLA